MTGHRISPATVWRLRQRWYEGMSAGHAAEIVGVAGATACRYFKMFDGDAKAHMPRRARPHGWRKYKGPDWIGKRID